VQVEEASGGEDAERHEDYDSCVDTNLDDTENYAKDAFEQVHPEKLGHKLCPEAGRESNERFMGIEPYGTEEDG